MPTPSFIHRATPYSACSSSMLNQTSYGRGLRKLKTSYFKTVVAREPSTISIKFMKVHWTNLGKLLNCFSFFFRGGLETGDIIVKLNGHPLYSVDALQSALQEDTPLLLEVNRGNDDLLFNIEPQIIMQWRKAGGLEAGLERGLRMGSSHKGLKELWTVNGWWVLKLPQLALCDAEDQEVQ